MNIKIERIKKIRSFLIDSVSEITVDQLNEIPHGFNNNIIWNLGHLTAAFQGVCYVRSGLKPAVDEKHIAPFKSGTKPEHFITGDEEVIIKKLLLSSLDLFNEDYQKNLFSNYISWTSRYGVELTHIDEAIDFIMYHEGLHSGFIGALKKLVKK